MFIFKSESIKNATIKKGFGDTGGCLWNKQTGYTLTV